MTSKALNFDPKMGTRGVERVCYELAKEANSVSPYIDKGRLCLFVPNSQTVVLHRKSELQDLPAPDSVPYEHEDHWVRAFVWTARALKAMGLNDKAKDVMSRLIASQDLIRVAKEILPEIIAAHETLFKSTPKLSKLSLGYSDVVILEGKIARHEGPKDGSPTSIITIAPSAQENPDYVRDVVKHELIHYVLGNDMDQQTHDETFLALADAVGLPEKYQD